MKIDRIAEDIFVMMSERYAQVTATALLTSEGAIVVDTLPFPSEGRQIAAFIDDKLGPGRVRYVINTHHHADHVYGTFLFEDAEVVAHDRCRVLLEHLGQSALDRARIETPELAEVELRLPGMTFSKQLHIHVGHRHLHLIHTPGHTADAIIAFVVDEKAVIAGDTMMPVPHIVRGDWRQLIESLKLIKSLRPNFVVQGHGEILLRGEVDENINSSIQYLNCIVSKVQEAVDAGAPPESLREIDIEACSKSRIPLDGLVTRLHNANLIALYREFSKAAEAPVENA